MWPAITIACSLVCLYAGIGHARARNWPLAIFCLLFTALFALYAHHLATDYGWGLDWSVQR